MLAYCKYHGIGVIPWSPLAGGRLARPLAAEETPRAKAFASRGRGIPNEVDAEIIKRVEEIAKERGWKMSHVALSWVASKIASPIVGISSASCRALLRRAPSDSLQSSLKDSTKRSLTEKF